MAKKFRGYRENDDDLEKDDDVVEGTEEGVEEEENTDAVLGEDEEASMDAKDSIAEDIQDADIENDEDVVEMTEGEDEVGGGDDDGTGSNTENMGADESDLEVSLPDIEEIEEAADATFEEIEAVEKTLYPELSPEQVGMFGEPFTSLPDTDGDPEPEMLGDKNGDDFSNTSYEEPLVGGGDDGEGEPIGDGDGDNDDEPDGFTID